MEQSETNSVFYGLSAIPAGLGLLWFVGTALAIYGGTAEGGFHGIFLLLVQLFFAVLALGLNKVGQVRGERNELFGRWVYRLAWLPVLAFVAFFLILLLIHEVRLSFP